MNEQKCFSLLYDLLKARDKIDHASAYVADFVETTRRCSAYYNLNDCRADYEDYLGKERLERISGACETEADEKMAGRAMLHYASWHHQRMRSCLPWSFWMYYHTLGRSAQHNGKA